MTPVNNRVALACPQIRPLLVLFESRGAGVVS